MSRHVACVEVLAETLRRTSRLAAHARDMAMRTPARVLAARPTAVSSTARSSRSAAARSPCAAYAAASQLRRLSAMIQVAGGLDLREVVVDELDDLGVSPLIHEAERNRSEREPHGQFLTSAQGEVARAQKLVERPRPLEVPRGTDAIGAHHGREPRGAARDEALVRVVHVVEAVPCRRERSAALHESRGGVPGARRRARPRVRRPARQRLPPRRFAR